MMIGAEYEASSSSARHRSAPVFLSKATRHAPSRPPICTITNSPSTSGAAAMPQIGMRAL